MTRKILVLSDLHVGRNDGLEEVQALKDIVDRIRSTYANDDPKPLIILCGDSVDHCTTIADSLVAAIDKMLGLPTTVTNWYQVLAEVLKPLSPEYTILSIIGNHDASGKESATGIASVIHAESGSGAENTGSSFLEGLGFVCTFGQVDYSLVDAGAQEDINGALSSYARLCEYDPDRISGISIDPEGMNQYYSCWHSMANAVASPAEEGFIPNVPDESRLVVPTEYVFNEPYWLMLKTQSRNVPSSHHPHRSIIGLTPLVEFVTTLFGRKKEPTYVDLPSLDPSLEVIMPHLVTFDRGSEVLPISSLDRRTPTNAADRKIGLSRSDGGYVEATLASRFFLHDGHLRLSSGYVDSVEMERSEAFLRESEERHRVIKAKFEAEFSAKVRGCQLPDFIESSILKGFIPVIPRAAKILALHHYFSYEISAFNLTTAQYLAWYLRSRTIAYRDGRYDSSNKAEDRNRIFELSSRLALVEHEPWFKFICASPNVADHNGDRTINHLLKYGRNNRSNIKFSAAYYDNNCQDNYSADLLGTFDGIVNLQPGMDGVNIREPDPGMAAMGAFLEVASRFDVAVVGHRHNLNISNLTESLLKDRHCIDFQEQIASVNSQLADVATWGKDIGDARDYLRYLEFIEDEATTDVDYVIPTGGPLNTFVHVSMGDWNGVRERLNLNIITAVSNVDTRRIDRDYITKNMLRWIVECPKSTGYVIRLAEIGNYDDGGGKVNPEQEMVPWNCWIEINTACDDDVVKPVVRRFTTRSTSY